MNYIDIIVKASLDFKTSATNIQLNNEPALVRTLSALYILLLPCFDQFVFSVKLILYAGLKTHLEVINAFKKR